MRHVGRRGFLGLVGAGAAGLAGCSASESTDADPGGARRETADSTPSAAASPGASGAGSARTGTALSTADALDIAEHALVPSGTTVAVEGTVNVLRDWSRESFAVRVAFTRDGSPLDSRRVRRESAGGFSAGESFDFSVVYRGAAPVDRIDQYSVEVL